MVIQFIGCFQLQVKKKKKPKGTHTQKNPKKPVNNRLFLFSLKKKPKDRGGPKLVHLAAQ